MYAPRREAVAAFCARANWQEQLPSATRRSDPRHCMMEVQKEGAAEVRDRTGKFESYTTPTRFRMEEVRSTSSFIASISRYTVPSGP